MVVGQGWENCMLDKRLSKSSGGEGPTAGVFGGQSGYCGRGDDNRGCESGQSNILGLKTVSVIDT